MTKLSLKHVFKFWIPTVILIGILIYGINRGFIKDLLGLGKVDTVSEASEFTKKIHQEMLLAFPNDNKEDFNNASRGFIAKPNGKVLAKDGSVIWDFDRFEFLNGASPDTANPSLWNHAQLNHQVGLFLVRPGIYQLRGFDLANITLIEGKTGWIVVDTLTSEETASAALAFAKKHLGEHKISGIIFTHSHIDHFGGALGILSTNDALIQKTPIIAPAGFMQEATSENVLLSSAMGRRAAWQFGSMLEANPKGLIDVGLGQSIALGQTGILAPTILINSRHQEVLIDGVKFIFENTPSAEAPSELTFYLPDLKALCASELAVQTLHNLYTLRGAKVRDPLVWSAYLDEMISRNKDKEVLFASHQWPVWGATSINTFLKSHRDTYRYIHDQTVRMINSGMRPDEIAEQIRIPKSLSNVIATRGYYGSVNTNVKAVYQFYMGWFDGNPTHLNPIPAIESSKRYVLLMGGASKVIEEAKHSMKNGDYRWAAELLNHIVYSNSRQLEARTLLASCYDQLAYQAESSIWRNFYASAAVELRGTDPQTASHPLQSFNLLVNTPIESFLQSVAANLNGPKAEGVNLSIGLNLIDTNQHYVLWIENSVLHFAPSESASSYPGQALNASLNLTRIKLVELLIGKTSAKDVIINGGVKVTGSTIDLFRFLALLDKPKGLFPISTPASSP